MFERYVNFEFYQTKDVVSVQEDMFERYVNFEFYQTVKSAISDKRCLRDM